MIPLLLALAAQAAPVASDEARFAQCAALAKSSPEQAVQSANDWLVKGGGLFARQCLGLAYVGQERWAPAATVYEQAAREAEKTQDARRADLWVQSGNASLAAGDAAKARTAFDAALTAGQLSPQLRGEVHLDRARAAVALGDLAGARRDIDKGLELVPSDPFGWYLSSALAMREEKIDRAKNDIAKAIALAPDDADVLVQAGTIAGLTGEVEAAQGFYARAARADPNSVAGKAAAAALAANTAAPKPQ